VFEKFLSGNIESFRQRYEGTFGFYKDESGKRLLVKLVEINPGRCSFVDGAGIAYALYPDSPREVGFEFLPPKSAWYNTQRGAVYTQRYALRQFQRGVTSKTLEMNLLIKGVLHPLRVDFENLSALYEKSILPKDAFKGLDEGRSLAISNQFAFDEGSVLLFRAKIGEYKRDVKTFTIKLDEPDLWRTEITDALSAMGCTASIS
jgi:hypothetical protein